jgi:hypothetical protein
MPVATFLTPYRVLRDGVVACLVASLVIVIWEFTNAMSYSSDGFSYDWLILANYALRIFFFQFMLIVPPWLLLAAAIWLKGRFSSARRGSNNSSQLRFLVGAYIAFAIATVLVWIAVFGMSTVLGTIVRIVKLLLPALLLVTWRMIGNSKRRGPL